MPSKKVGPQLDKINKEFNKSKNKAESLIKDKDKVKDVLDKATKKANKMKKSDGTMGPIEKIWDTLQLMFGITKDWMTGKYKDVPIGSMIAIIAGLIYFLSPIDVIPDFIPVIGYLDDVLVIGLVAAQVDSDLQKYKKWKEKQKK